MTDKEKLSKVRAEIERRRNEIKKEEPSFDNYTTGWHDGKLDLLCDLLSFIDSLQEEPKSKFKVGDKVMPKRFKPDEVGLYLNEPERIIDIVGGYYILDHNQAYKIECQEHWELVEEPESKFEQSIQEGDNIVYNEDLGCRVNLSQLDRVAKKEEPKKCMYTKDNYTDEDRKVLCDGCEEECKYAQKQADWLQELHCKLDSLSKEDFEKVWAKYHQKEEPVSEDLGEYINELSKQFPEVSFAKLSRIAVRVAKWKKKQFEKNRLKHCNSITNEQAELEQGFIDQHLDKYNRMPTFLDAIEYGMQFKEQQLLAKAIDGTARPDDNEIWCNLASSNLKDGDKVKVIVIKKK